MGQDKKPEDDHPREIQVYQHFKCSTVPFNVPIHTDVYIYICVCEYNFIYEYLCIVITTYLRTNNEHINTHIYICIYIYMRV